MKKDHDLIIAKPDKGQGVVILQREDYIAKMDHILSDTSKFCETNENLYSLVTRMEDKTNRIIDRMKATGVVDAQTSKRLTATGSRPPSCMVDQRTTSVALHCVLSCLPAAHSVLTCLSGWCLNYLVCVVMNFVSRIPLGFRNLFQILKILII